MDSHSSAFICMNDLILFLVELLPIGTDGERAVQQRVHKASLVCLRNVAIIVYVDTTEVRFPIYRHYKLVHHSGNIYIKKRQVIIRLHFRYNVHVGMLNVCIRLELVQEFNVLEQQKDFIYVLLIVHRFEGNWDNRLDSLYARKIFINDFGVLQEQLSSFNAKCDIVKIIFLKPLFL